MTAPNADYAPEPGDYIEILWTDEDGPQSAAGRFECWDTYGYCCLDWGYGVSRDAPDFRIMPAQIDGS